MKLTNFIDGEPRAPLSNAYLDNINPATNRVVSSIPRSGPEDAQQAIAAAQRAFQGPWGAFSAPQRADVMEQIADRIEARVEEFALAESIDNGKPFGLAKKIDIPRAVANFRFFAGAIRQDQTGCHMAANALNYTLRKPLGVVTLITPWNLPVYLLTWKMAPAMAMGNTIVAKPSEMTPTTASLLAEVCLEAGLPKGVFNVVHGLGAEAGAPLCSSPIVKAVSFTGGTATGRLVAASAAPQFKKLSLELGGKNASIVFADCDFDATVAGVTRAAFLNQGQICLCGSRILVERAIYDRFTAALAACAERMVVGDPLAEESELGALISLSHRDKVEGYIRSALKDGGRVLAGGDRPVVAEALRDGAWLSPTLIVDVPTDCKVSTEEIFGPVAVVHPFDTEEEALTIANGVEYGLAGSVWTNDLKRGHRVAAGLETGMVWVNTWLNRDLRVPFGGVKNSGVGREGGTNSLRFFSDSQNICIQLH